MSHFDDEAQAADLKKWISENWTALVAGLVIGLGAIFGWEGWQRYQAQQAAQASQIFEDMKEAYAGSKADEAQKLGERLLTDYAGTPYSAAAALKLAAVAVEADKLEEASARLSWVVANSSDEGLRQLARLRHARVLWAQNKLDEALAQINTEPGAYAALYEELRGDIKLTQGDRAAARAAYQKALAAAEANDRASRESIQRKLDDLADVATS